MVEEGHTIGLHTYCHDYDVIYRSVDDFLADYEKLYQRLYEVAGLTPSIFRFPGGSTNRYGKATIKAVKNEMERRGFCFGAVIIGLNQKSTSDSNAQPQWQYNHVPKKSSVYMH